jgi:hypothetical protein
MGIQSNSSNPFMKLVVAMDIRDQVLEAVHYINLAPANNGQAHNHLLLFLPHSLFQVAKMDLHRLHHHSPLVGFGSKNKECSNVA